MSPVEGIPEVVAAADIKMDVVAEDAVVEVAAVEVTEEPSLDSQVAEKVVSQVKHYFSDVNLNHDSFMRKGVSMNDGWVLFSTLIRFNKLRQLIGVPEDPKVDDNKRGKKRAPRPPPIAKKFVDLLAATVKSGVSDEDKVEVNDTGVRRKEPYVESGEWFSRTVHVKGMPYGKEPADIFEELTAFFSQHGEVTLLRLRRNPKTKAFKGNVLVEFATVEQAEAVTQMTDLVFNNHKLAITSLSAYHDEKRDGGEYMHPELQKPGETYPTHEEWCLANGRESSSSQGDKKGKKPAAAEAKEITAVPGVLVKFTGLEGEIGIAELKKAFAVAGDVKYVDIQTGATEGIVRFKNPVADQVIESHADGLPVEDSSVVLKLEAVGEEEEKAFYERARASSANANARNSNGKRSGGRDNGGGQRRSKRTRN